MQQESSAVQIRTLRSSSISVKAKPDLATLEGCEKGDLQVALNNMKKFTNRYDSNNEEVPFNVDVQYFKKYGTGIYLFFHFAKRLAILFSMFAAISIIPLILNKINGDAFSPMIKTLGIYFAQTTLGNLNGQPTKQTTLTLEQSQKYKLYSAIPDLIISFMFLIFYIYWQVKSDKLTEQIKEEVKFQCHYTLEVNQFAPGVSEAEVKTFFNQFGQVKQVASVQNYSQLIDYSKDIYELEQKKKELSLEIENIQNSDEKQYQETKLKDLNDKIALIENKFMLVSKQSALSVLRYYVVFQDIYSRQLALKTLRGYNKCFKWGIAHIPKNHLLNGEKVGVSPCHNQPADIIWQNQHLQWHSRLIRTVLQIILLIVIVSCTFLVISLLNIAAPSTSTYLDVSMYDSNNIRNVTNSTVLYVWCINNKDLMSYSPSINNLCKNYIAKYYISILIGVLISCVVVGIKFVLRIIVVRLAKFQRHKGHTEQSIAIMKSLFYTYLCTTTLITVLLQAKIFGISFKEFIEKTVSSAYLKENSSLLLQFHDFSPFWYVDIGYKINITMIIMALYKPLASPIIFWIKQKWMIWRASKQVTQKSMQKMIIPDAFDIEDHYANILLIMFMACSFSTGMPLIMISCAIAFVLRYFYFKLVFIRFNHIPNALDEALNQNVINTIPFMLLFHFLFGIWMLSARSIFKGEDSFVSKLLTSEHNFSQNVGQILRRLGDTWYFTIAFLVCVSVIILKVIFYDLIYENYKARSNDRITTQKLKVLKLQTLEIKVNPKDIVEEATLTHSYKIENNPKYFQILAIMNKLKKQTHRN